MNAKIEFLGLAFDPVSNADVERWIAGRDAGSPFAYLVTPNVDHVVQLPEAGEDVRSAYEEADLLVCDSRILSRLASLCGIHLPTAPGSDLVEGVFKRVLRPGDRICVIGGAAESADRLQRLYPDLDIRHHLPPMGLRHDRVARAAAVAFAREAEARLILLGVGAPQQEILAHEMALAGNIKGTALCTGAAVEFLIGAKRRAPSIVQSAGMEWAWRLLTEPRRLARRYLINDPVVFPMAWRWWRENRGKRR